MYVLEYKLVRLSMTPDKEKAILMGSLIIFEELLKRTSNRSDEALQCMYQKKIGMDVITMCIFIVTTHEIFTPSDSLALKQNIFSCIQCSFEEVRSKTITCLALYALEDDV